MLEMALRRDVARCVKVVGILTVDSDVENSRLLLMKFSMPLGSEFRSARGRLKLSSPRVGYHLCIYHLVHEDD